MVGHVVRQAVQPRRRSMRHLPEGVGKPPSANGASGTGSLAQPSRQQRVEVQLGPAKAVRASVSSSSRKQGSSKPMRRGQLAEDLGVRRASPSGAIAGWLHQRVGVAVAGVHVPVLELVVAAARCRRGRRCRSEVLQHDGEEVVAREAFTTLATPAPPPPGCCCRRSAPLDLSGRSRARRAQQVVADGDHVDGAACALPAGRALQRRLVAEAGTSPRTDSMPPPRRARRRSRAGQDRHQPHRALPPPCTLHAVVEADRRRLGRAVVARQASWRTSSAPMPQTSAVRRASRPWRARAGSQPFGVARDVVVVQPVVDDQLAHQASASARRCRAAARCAGGTCRPSRSCAGRCRSASRRCAWPAARRSRNAG